MEVYQWTQRRLAYLVEDDALFAAIRNVQYRDYQGKFVVFYKKERVGRLFEFYEQKGNGRKYRFLFPEEAGAGAPELLVNSLADIDAPLLKSFTQRVAAVG